MTPLQQEALDAYREHGSQRLAAEALGITRDQVKSRLRGARRYLANNNPETVHSRLEDAGYDLDKEPMTPEEAWDKGHDTFERKVSSALSKQWRKLKRPKGPVVLFHCTDQHVDDDGCALKLLERDIQDSHDLGAVMCHGGDLLNNWPMGSRLTSKWSEQSCTLEEAILRAKHFIRLFKPDVWTDGNHEEMNPYLVNMYADHLPPKIIKDYWAVNFIVDTGDRPVRAVLSHKFQKGSSWFHKTHGQLREMLEGQEADVLMDGHLHSDGVLEHSLPERGHASLCVASGGYKFADKYARRISKGSLPKIRGRAHWCVFDTQAEPDETFGVAFKSAQQAEAYLNGLQSLRAV